VIKVSHHWMHSSRCLFGFGFADGALGSGVFA